MRNSHLGYVRMHDRAKSSLIKKVKAIQYMDPTLVELKKLVIDKKVEVFS